MTNADGWLYNSMRDNLDTRGQKRHHWIRKHVSYWWHFKGSLGGLDQGNNMILGRRVIRDVQENKICGKSGEVPLFQAIEKWSIFN